MNRYALRGFTLIELLVTIAIIGILATIVYASFGQAREQTRDKSRTATLKELQLAVETYKAQVGRYPAAGCGVAATSFAGPGSVTMPNYVSCATYIVGLVPEYIGSLPTDPAFEAVSDKGIFYRSDGVSYKIILHDVVEELQVTSFADKFARCPSAVGACASGVPSTTYAVYSLGAEGW
jgi:prepilin-type N-terminal cleavage/methylation domain-containing protein